MKNNFIKYINNLSVLNFAIPFICIFFINSLYAQTNFKVMDGYKVYKDLTYKTVGNWNGLLDLYLPSDSIEKTPLVLMFHGGGWNHGKKEDIERGALSFLKLGFAVANVEYRLLDVAPAPAAVEDARCALLWLVAHAKEYNIDVEKIITTGASAGGHLALMTGLLPPGNKFDDGCIKTNDYKVVVIINKYGISDLSLFLGKTHWLDGTVNQNSLAKDLSPILYLNKNSAPIISIHGTSDPTVPFEQAEKMHKILDSLGVKNFLFKVPDGKHGKFAKEINSEFSRDVKNFLTELGILKVKNN